MNQEDTIAAISTPLGYAGIGIVRASGPNAKNIGKLLFCKPNGKGISFKRPHTLHYGFIIDPETKNAVDEVLVAFMKAPNTYTKEDVLEIDCHGGSVSLKAILELVLSHGARLAEPGEFTKRAFMNGRIDLAQAEAVIDIIKAKTDRSSKMAMRQLEGRLSEEIDETRERLMNVASQLEASLDFSEEVIKPWKTEDLLAEAEAAENEVNRLLTTANDGIYITEGIRIALVGRPNVGKSSLLNALVNRERAIVTPMPGTTRDVIEEVISVDGIPFVLIDTAGIGKARGVVERIGIDRARKALSQADVVLCVIDGSQALTEDDHDVLSEIKDRNALLIVNKKDLPASTSENAAIQFLGKVKKPVIQVSAVSKEGLDDILKQAVNLVLSGVVEQDHASVVTNMRHKEALEQARTSLSQATNALKEGLSEEYIVTDIKEAIGALGEIIGETVSEDILDRIFNDFCIGK